MSVQRWLGVGGDSGSYTCRLPHRGDPCPGLLPVRRLLLPTRSCAPAETATVVAVINGFRTAHQLCGVTIVGDAGMIFGPAMSVGDREFCTAGG